MGQRLELKTKNEKVAALKLQNSQLNQFNEMMNEQKQNLSQKLITFEEQYKLLNEKFVSLINSDHFESNSDLYLNDLSHKYNDLLLKFESFDFKNEDSVNHTINQVFIKVYINIQVTASTIRSL
jgi:alanyl-tRNA synthetase